MIVRPFRQGAGNTEVRVYWLFLCGRGRIRCPKPRNAATLPISLLPTGIVATGVLLIGLEFVRLESEATPRTGAPGRALIIGWPRQSAGHVLYRLDHAGGFIDDAGDNFRTVPLGAHDHFTIARCVTVDL